VADPVAERKKMSHDVMIGMQMMAAAKHPRQKLILARKFSTRGGTGGVLVSVCASQRDWFIISLHHIVLLSAI
jgi:hypothetical protein